MRLENFDQMPEIIKAEIRSNYPIYEQPPPIDDPRPKQTSWTVTKQAIDAERARQAED
jgi:hypothetical protein